MLKFLNDMNESESSSPQNKNRHEYCKEDDDFSKFNIEVEIKKDDSHSSVSDLKERDSNEFEPQGAGSPTHQDSEGFFGVTIPLGLVHSDSEEGSIGSLEERRHSRTCKNNQKNYRLSDDISSKSSPYDNFYKNKPSLKVIAEKFGSLKRINKNAFVKQDDDKP
mmetsp:Transcript_2725/g.3415  ORF Transcript_2725/g.3415 Transcript_2725/m.3415 type:complete len:164 (-) Transcript_2725:340-831(-)